MMFYFKTLLFKNVNYVWKINVGKCTYKITITVSFLNFTLKYENKLIFY